MNRLLRSTVMLRIFALILACMIWLGVNEPNNGGFGNVNGPERFPFPIHVDVSPDMVVTELDNPTAEVIVNSDSLLTTGLPSQMMGVSIVADARGLTPGTHVVALHASNMPAVTFNLDPINVTLTIERKAVAHMDVRLSVSGSPATGYSAGTAVADTQSVEVSGVQSAVSQVQNVVANVSIQDATQLVTKVVNLKAVDKNGKVVPGVSLNPMSVTVSVPIQPPQAVANVVPQMVGSPAAGYAVAGMVVNPVAVVVNGSPAATANLQTINVPVDVTGFQATQTLKLRLPVHGTVTFEPATVQVTVKIERSVTKSFTDVPIQVNNVPSGTTVKLTGTQTTSVTIAGPESLVNALTADQVNVYIDGKSLNASSTSAQLHVSVPDWIQVTTVSDADVPIQVTQ